MTEGRFRPRARAVVRALLAMLVGMLAGGALNAALGEQGADTPALALLGGGLWRSASCSWRGPDGEPGRYRMTDSTCTRRARCSNG